MEESRDEIIRSNEIYEGTSWDTRDTIPIEELHDICKAAIEKCIPLITPVANRFNNLRGQTALRKKAERRWLVGLLEKWFAKKWNNKRGADANKTGGSKKRKSRTCEGCGEMLHCLGCEDITDAQVIQT